MRIVIKIFSFLVVLLASGSFCLAKELPRGPVQSSIGPGGREYFHKRMVTRQVGIQENKYFIFEPSEPTPKKAGIIYFFHDWMTSDPGFYMAWIRHLCLKGWIVVFPNYQGVGELDKYHFFNIVRSLKDSVLNVFKEGKIEIDRERVGIIGHGAGAVHGANVAAASRYFGLPIPGVMVLITPVRRTLKLLDLSGIRQGTKLVMIVGDRIFETTENTAREIFYAADRIKTNDKTYLTVLSDFHGSPPVVADELMGLAPENPYYEKEIDTRRHEFITLFNDRFHAHTLRTRLLDAIDWNGSFRIFDSLAEYHFNGKKEFNVLKNSDSQRFLGYWSDGKRLKGLISTHRP